MVELQDHRIPLAAIHAGVLQQVLPHEFPCVVPHPITRRLTLSVLLGGCPVVRGVSHLGARLAGSVETVSARSEEHTSELQSLMRISYAVFCLKKQNHKHINTTHDDRECTQDSQPQTN